MKSEISHDPKTRALAHLKAARYLIAFGWHSIRASVVELGKKGPEAKAAAQVSKDLVRPFARLFRLILKMEKGK